MGTTHIINQHCSLLSDMEAVLKMNGSNNFLSPQLARRLEQLFIAARDPNSSVQELTRRTSSVFRRLILELIQAQFNTKQREQDVIRLIESRGCYIRDPELIDQVIELLVRLYKASVQYSDSSLERRNLIKYIMKELKPNQRQKQRNIEKIVQTIYRCSCFEVTQQPDGPSRLKLKEHLYDVSSLRYQLDIELIQLAKENSIRLTPESWAYLLHGRSSPEHIAMFQTILDKNTPPADFAELEIAVKKSGDKLCLGQFLDQIHLVERMIQELESAPVPSSVQDVESHATRLFKIIEKLNQLSHLFSARQHRSKYLEPHW